MTEWREPRYFPAQCPAGHRPFLAAVSADPARPNPLRCPVCDAEGRVLPGAYYTQATRERFDRVARALHESELTREERACAVGFLDRAARDSDTDANTLSQMLAQVPTLGQLAALIPSDRNERHAFVGLVLSLLVAGVSAQPNEPAPAASHTSAEPSPDAAEEPPPLEPAPANDDPTQARGSVEQAG